MKIFRRQAEGGIGAPAWVVSYTDMVTLLLAFFVILQACAKEWDPELFYQGQGSFRRDIAGMGIPDVLFGKANLLEGMSPQVRFPTEQVGSDARRRVIDAEDQRIRRAFQDLRKVIETRTAKTHPRASHIILTPVRFPSGTAFLDEAAREYLRGLAASLGQGLEGRAVRIFVVGSAPDQPPSRRRWLLATRRAEAAADFLAQSLPAWSAESPWSLVPLGEGTGGQQHIRITVVGEDEHG